MLAPSSPTCSARGTGLACVASMGIAVGATELVASAGCRLGRIACSRAPYLSATAPTNAQLYTLSAMWHPEGASMCGAWCSLVACTAGSSWPVLGTSEISTGRNTVCDNSWEAAIMSTPWLSRNVSRSQTNTCSNRQSRLLRQRRQQTFNRQQGTNARRVVQQAA